jgi:hypothetical protein
MARNVTNNKGMIKKEISERIRSFSPNSQIFVALPKVEEV